jgi:ATP-dependent RNA helicase DDX24/MAK5
MGMKRGRESRGSGDKSKKKLRVEKSSSGADADTDAARVFGIDELDWKEVKLPDRLEDAGGFFGLEEIEGVDIVRPGALSEIEFKVGLLEPGLNNSFERPLELTLRQGRRKQIDKVDSEEVQYL